MAKVSKVQKSDGTVIMDISQDNVNANNLLQGGTAHGSDGEAVQGAVITHNVIDNLTSDSTTDALSAKQGKVLKGLVDDKVSKSGDTMTGDLTFNVGGTGGVYNERGIKSSTANSQVSVSNSQSKMIAGNELGSYASVSARNGASVKAVTIEAYSDTDDEYTSFEVAQDGVYYNDEEIATKADLNSYLPLSGGTMTGDLTMAVGTIIKSNNGKNQLRVDNVQSYLQSSGIGDNTGSAFISLNGNSPQLTIKCYDPVNTINKYITLSASDIEIGTGALLWSGGYSTVPTGTGTNLVIDSSGYIKKSSITNNPLSHNGIYRGKDLTDIYTVEQIYERVHNGTFEDLYLGDYFTKSITTDIYTKFTGTAFVSGTTYYERSGADLNNWTYAATSDATYNSSKTYYTKLTKTENVSFMFAAFDYYYNKGDAALTTHHAILIPRNYGFATTSWMNPTNTTVGSYYNSEMHQTTLPCYAKSIKTTLNNHLLSHKTILPNAINASTYSMAGAGMIGASSASAWYTTELQLMTEHQLFGSGIWASSAYDVGCDGEKLPIFNFINGVQYGRYYFWLRSVVNSTGFASCGNFGVAIYGGASYANHVRPLILFG